jgi:peptidoglycan/LPS O-acetylase OafA/YrhL
VRKLTLSDRARRHAGHASVALVGVIVGALYLVDAHPLGTVRDDFGLVDVLFMPLVVTLAIGAGTLPALLSTRLMVYGGQVSFGLYMVHELVHTAWLWIMAQYHVTMVPSINAKLVFVGLIVVAVALGVVLFHVVEEPARIWMRRMVGERRLPVTETHAEQADEPVKGTLAPILGSREERSKTLRARAG